MPNGTGSTAAVRRQDRRRCVRRKVLANGEMISVDLGPLESGLLLDICARGASVQGLKPLRPGARISLKFRLPGSDISVQPTYEVIWADRNGKIGLKFLYIAEREQRLLDEWAAAYFPTPEPEPAFEPPQPPDSAAAIADSVAATIMTLEQELARVVEQAGGYASAEGAAIALREQRGIVCRASWGNAPDIGVLLNPNSGLSGECIRTGASVYCADTLTDARVDTIAAHRLSLRSALIVPIKIDDTVQGVIEVLSSRPAAFTPAHLTSLERLAEIVGFLVGPVALPAESMKVAEPVAPEASAFAPPAEPPPAPYAELPNGEVAPESASPAVGAPEPGTVAAAPNDVAGIIQLIEPELRPVPITVQGRSSGHTEMVAIDGESAPRQAVEPAGSPVAATLLPSLPKEPQRGISMSILAATVFVSGVLLVAMWLLAPRWLPKRSPHTALPVAASSQRPPVPSAPLPSSPAPLVQAPSGSPPTSRSAPRKTASDDASSDETAPSDQDDDVTVVTWVNGRKFSAKPAGRSGTDANVLATPMPVGGADASPLRVTSQAMLDRVINRPAPEYPEEARRNRIEGVVTLRVIVGADGRVETATPISGSPILAVAAGKAVAQWRYHPYLLNGKPIRVETTVTVGFRRG